MALPDDDLNTRVGNVEDVEDVDLEDEDEDELEGVPLSLRVTNSVTKKKKKSPPRRICKDASCTRKFKPLNIRHEYCSHRCKNRSGARRRQRRDRQMRRTLQKQVGVGRGV